jgi:hypothetical protein
MKSGRYSNRKNVIVHHFMLKKNYEALKCNVTTNNSKDYILYHIYENVLN